ncbi:MAG: transglycosylase SLT domain-containing protein [Rhodobacteraceae bacterium]|nr:transglycosylase SLT domain-containing protein [Paracoccaceae bacterium]
MTWFFRRVKTHCVLKRNASRGTCWITAVGVLILIYLLIQVTGARAECLRVTDEYDRHFEAAVRRHWATDLAGVPWLALKAQAITESSLRADAESPAGAVGLLQQLESTFNEEARRINLRDGNRRNARDSIEVGASYLAGRARFWTEPRPVHESWRLALAGYNSGSGNWYKVQVRYGGRYWHDFVPHIADFVGPVHEAEAAGYVPRVEYFYGRLNACGARR